MSDTAKSQAVFEGFHDDEVDRFLAGQSTPEEAERFQQLLGNDTVAAEWRHLFQGVEQPFAADLTNGAAHALLAKRLGEHTFGNIRPANVSHIPEPSGTWNRVRRISRGGVRQVSVPPVYAMIGVACSLFALVLGWQFYAPRGTSEASPRISSYTTGNGQRATITLPDGTVAVLNVASRLEVPVNYGTENRTVRLTGEALFTVSHQDNAAFTVLAGASVTRVLGTSFVVRHYSADSMATVVVRDGKVSVQNSNTRGKAAILTENEQVAVGWETLGLVRPGTPGQFGFAEGQLILEGMLLKDAIKELNRWYDVDIQLADPQLATRRITAECSAGSIADLAAILTVTFDDIGVVRDGRVLTLYRR